MADNIMVGQLGTNQMSGVAIINQLFFVFNLLVFGGMSGAGLFSAQYFGQKNHNGVRDVFRMKILIGIAIIAISLSVMIFLHEPLINMFLHEGSSSGNIQETFNYAKNYLYIMVIGIAPFVISNCYNTTLKESGQTVVPMKAGVLAVVFDIVLNYIFIFGKLYQIYLTSSICLCLLFFRFSLSFLCFFYMEFTFLIFFEFWCRGASLFVERFYQK